MSRLHCSPYAAAFMSAFLIAYLFIFFYLVKKGVPKRMIGYSLLFHTVTVLYFAKLYTVAGSGFSVSITNAGFSGLGGAIGLLLGSLIFAKLCPINRADFFLAYSLAIPLLYSISKIGCHFAGCCHGITYHGPCSISYDNAMIKADALFPIQLTETVVFFIIFLAGVCYAGKKQHPVSRCCGFVMLLCSLAKFSLEYLRAEHVGVILSMNQFVCICFFVVAVFLCIFPKRTQ